MLDRQVLVTQLPAFPASAQQHLCVCSCETGPAQTAPAMTPYAFQFWTHFFMNTVYRFKTVLSV